VIGSHAGQRTRTGWTPPADPPPGAPVPRPIGWEPVDRRVLPRAPSRAEDIDLPPRSWNRTALLAPLLALLCAPVGLCMGLVAAGQIGMGRQRGIGFAVAGIVIGSVIPVAVCGWGLFT